MEKRIVHNTERKLRNDFVITYFHQDWLNELAVITKEKLKDVEFVVHYTAINCVYELNGQKLIISIPLTFYTAKQEVSFNTISFDLESAIEMSHVASHISDLTGKEIKFILENAEEELGFKFNYEKSILNTMHKHNTQPLDTRFSSDDLSTDPNNPGIVFPFKEVPDNYVNTAIIFVNDNYHQTYEIAKHISNTIKNFEKEIVYKKANSVVYVKAETTEHDLCKRLGQCPSKASYVASEAFNGTSKDLYRIYNYLDKKLAYFMPNFLVDLDDIKIKGEPNEL